MKIATESIKQNPSTFTWEQIVKKPGIYCTCSKDGLHGSYRFISDGRGYIVILDTNNNINNLIGGAMAHSTWKTRTFIECFEKITIDNT